MYVATDKDAPVSLEGATIDKEINAADGSTRLVVTINTATKTGQKEKLILEPKAPDLDTTYNTITQQISTANSMRSQWKGRSVAYSHHTPECFFGVSICLNVLITATIKFVCRV